MNSSKVLFRIRYLVLPTTKYSVQSRCLHTNMVKMDRIEEQPHMRIAQKRTYNER